MFRLKSKTLKLNICLPQQLAGRAGGQQAVSWAYNTRPLKLSHANVKAVLRCHSLTHPASGVPRLVG
jgi:hypothetical protein